MNSCTSVIDSTVLLGLPVSGKMKNSTAPVMTMPVTASRPRPCTNPGRPIIWARRVATAGGRVAETRRRGHDREHMLGIISPVGSDMKESARFELAAQQFDERELDDAAFVVTLFRPRVGEEELHGIEGGVRQMILQHVHRVAANDADVVC